MALKLVVTTLVFLKLVLLIYGDLRLRRNIIARSDRYAPWAGIPGRQKLSQRGNLNTVFQFVFTLADGSLGGRVFNSVCLCVCLFFRTISKKLM